MQGHAPSMRVLQRNLWQNGIEVMWANYGRACTHEFFKDFYNSYRLLFFNFLNCTQSHNTTYTNRPNKQASPFSHAKSLCIYIICTTHNRITYLLENLLERKIAQREHARTNEMLQTNDIVLNIIYNILWYRI